MEHVADPGHIPNAETIAAIKEVEAMIRGDIPERVMTVEELFKPFKNW